METQMTLKDLSNLIQLMQDDIASRIEDIEHELDDLYALIEQQDTQIRNLRNEG